jgi:hypothetical protein
MEVIATHIVPSSYSSSPQTHGENVSSNVDFKASVEERFGVDAETADEPNQIEFVGDLIRYIESSTKEEKLEQTG